MPALQICVLIVHYFSGIETFVYKKVGHLRRWLTGSIFGGI
jgi:hypothetical protein